MRFVRARQVPPECNYLTEGKLYRVIKEWGIDGIRGAEIMDDTGVQIPINYESSAHLKWDAWEIINTHHK